MSEFQVRRLRSVAFYLALTATTIALFAGSGAWLFLFGLLTAAFIWAIR